MQKINIFFVSFQIRFIDNTDPAGIDHQIAQLGPELASTLVIVISKVHIDNASFLGRCNSLLVLSLSLLRSVCYISLPSKFVANVMFLPFFSEWRNP